MNRRTVLAGTAAVLASPLLTALPALADAKRQSLVDQSLRSATKVLSGKDYPDALKNMTKARGVIIVPELVQRLRQGAADISQPARLGDGRNLGGCEEDLHYEITMAA